MGPASFDLYLWSHSYRLRVCFHAAAQLKEQRDLLRRCEILGDGFRRPTEQVKLRKYAGSFQDFTSGTELVFISTIGHKMSKDT
jgi:hypothetical protein